MVWECDTISNTFMGEIVAGGGGSFEEFRALDNFERTGFVLGCENWDRSNFKALLSLVKNFVLSGWGARKMAVRIVRHQVALAL